MNFVTENSAIIIGILSVIIGIAQFFGLFPDVTIVETTNSVLNSIAIILAGLGITAGGVTAKQAKITAMAAARAQGISLKASGVPYNRD